MCVRGGGGGWGGESSVTALLVCFISLPAVSCLALCEEWEMTSLIQKPPASSPPYLPPPYPTPYKFAGVFYGKKDETWLARTHARTHERAVDLQKGVYYDKSMDIYMYIHGKITILSPFFFWLFPACPLIVSWLLLKELALPSSAPACPLQVEEIFKNRAFLLLLLFKCSVDFILIHNLSSSCVRKHGQLSQLA